MRKPRRCLEAQLHAAVVLYLRLALPRAVVHHSPNEGKRSRWAQREIKTHGVLAGFPDLAVFVDAKVVLIELKAPDGKLSKPQVETHLRLNVAGFPVYVCRSIDDVQSLLARLGISLRPGAWLRELPNPFDLAKRLLKSEAPPAGRGRGLPTLTPRR